MIFEALQSELFRFKFHSLGSKILKFPDFNLCMWDNILVSGKNIFEVEVLDEFYAKMSEMKGRY